MFDRAVEKGFSENWVKKALETHPEELSEEDEEEQEEEGEGNEKAKKMRQVLRAQKIKASQTKRFRARVGFFVSQRASRRNAGCVCRITRREI